MTNSASHTLALLRTKTPQLWLNPHRRSAGPSPLDGTAFAEAEDRFRRAAGLLAHLFPELGPVKGVIESPLHCVPGLQAFLGLSSAAGALFVKADHQLPIAGSIKARGGFHEVLAHAESIAMQAGLIRPDADLLGLALPEVHQLFSGRTIAVGSTGNLGLSIGTLAAALGFKAEVHMSSDAKTWKKQALRSRGALVVEHQGDYALAMANGRRRCLDQAGCYFVDDEDSELLFEGYAAAAKPLARQLLDAGRTPTADQPLLVYIPCGVGGAPGGISAGLAALFGPHVHCFFAEPVASPCMLVKMADEGAGEDASVYGYGLDNQTEADGLAVPQASALVASRIRNLLSGVFTVEDKELFQGLLAAWDCEGLAIEPSAAAGFAGPRWLTGSAVGREYLQAMSLGPVLPKATHLLWTTGGALVPEADHEAFRSRARRDAARAAAR